LRLLDEALVLFEQHGAALSIRPLGEVDVRRCPVSRPLPRRPVRTRGQRSPPSRWRNNEIAAPDLSVRTVDGTSRTLCQIDARSSDALPQGEPIPRYDVITVSAAEALSERLFRAQRGSDYYASSALPEPIKQVRFKEVGDQVRGSRQRGTSKEVRDSAFAIAGAVLAGT
jgi:hypothetical protein